MIVVTSVLIPGGNVNVKQTILCNMTIVNDGTGSIKKGNYEVCLYSKGKKPRLIRKTRIENWNRISKPAWRLIAEAFKKLEIS